MKSGIGVFGGTFDPIHWGHIHLAEQIFKAFHLKEIRFIPCRDPVHKPDAHAKASKRCEMIKLAIDGHKNFVLDTREVLRDTPSYTIKTLLSLKKDFSKDPLYLIIGMDSLLSLTQWHKWTNLFDYAHIIAVPRPHYPLKIDALYPAIRERIVSRPEELNHENHGKIYIMEMPLSYISATEIRLRVKQGKSIDKMTPNQVAEYIKQNKLYLK